MVLRMLALATAATAAEPVLAMITDYHETAGQPAWQNHTVTRCCSHLQNVEVLQQVLFDALQLAHASVAIPLIQVSSSGSQEQQQQSQRKD